MDTSKLDIILDSFADVWNILGVNDDDDYESMLCRESWSTKSVYMTIIGSLSTLNENGVNVNQVLIAQTDVLQDPSAVDHSNAPEKS